MPQFNGHIRNFWNALNKERSEEMQAAEEMQRFQEMLNTAMMANAQNNFNMDPGAPVPVANPLDMTMPGIMPVTPMSQEQPEAPKPPPLIGALDDEEERKRTNPFGRVMGFLGMGQ